MNDYLAENGNCAETNVTFRIVGDAVEPERLTMLFGIIPSSGSVKGELLKSSSRVTVYARTGSWALETKGQLQTTSLERHVMLLLDQLEPVGAELRKLAEDPSVRVEFHCYWLAATFHGGPILSNAVLQRIVQLGARLDFDFYCSE